jgi:hypothetical protein
MTTFFGLDGEMSAAELHAGGRLIQIGAAAHTYPDGVTLTEEPDAFSMLLNPGSMSWDPESAAVHGFTREEIEAAAPAADVDDALYSWLVARGANPKRRENTIAVGFNVGSFDLPHLAVVLPKTYSLFSRRSLDLNSICFTLDGKPIDGTPGTWQQWKEAAKTHAIVTLAGLGYQEAEHDAGYDALLHLYVWRFLKDAATR